jgi:hypothetical protein
MASKNLSLTQVADRLATIGYIISIEGEEIAKQDLYQFAKDLEENVAALLALANTKEQQEL